MQIERILVTGGGGFLGKAIVKKLLIKNLEVVSFSRGFYTELDKLGVVQVQGDLSDSDAVASAMVKTDAVFHVAAKAGLWGTYDEFYQSNVVGTRNIIKACRKNQVKILIHTSSPSVVFDDSDMENVDESVPYPDHYLAPYPETKAMAERLVKKAAGEGLLSVILRPHLIWGPEDNHVVPNIIKHAKSLKKIGRTDDLVDTIYIDNAADAHILALEKVSSDPSLSGNVYFISQDDPVSKWDLANGFLDAAGLPPITGHVSARTAYMAGTFFEWMYKVFKIKKQPPMTRFAAKELATSHWFDISRAKRDLGYQPAVTTEEGLKRLKQWFESAN